MLPLFQQSVPAKALFFPSFFWVQNINNYIANNKDEQKDENLPHPLPRGENGARLIFNVGSLNLIQGPVPPGVAALLGKRAKARHFFG